LRRKVAILMTVDEQEPDPLVRSGGEEAAQQQRTVAADDEREPSIAEDHLDRVADQGHEASEPARIDEIGLRVALGEGVRQGDVTVVVQVRQPLERLNQAGPPEGRRCAGHTVDGPARVTGNSDEADGSGPPVHQALFVRRSGTTRW
jgi:hypothetical protein